jgi:Na+/H+ antiporter NhaD/arsenite permease-like protein
MKLWFLRLAWIFMAVLFFWILSSAAFAAEPPSSAEHQTDAIGETLPVWSALPFVGILLSIALFPLLAPVFWHHNFGRISLAWSLILAIPFLVAYQSAALHAILHVYIIDYIPFIILLGGLFTVSGGIYLRGSLAGTPLVNTMLLLVGTILASLIGTTGASMLLIRPVLRANKARQNKIHIIIFFIFLVSNIGGSLTPLGDPPLFLGFLHGVPFFWTMNLIPLMGLVSGLLLLILFLLDTVLYKREGSPKFDESAQEPLKIEGWHNFIFLGGIIGAVLLSGLWDAGEFSIFCIPVAWQDLVRDLLIILLGLLSWRTTSQQLRNDNGFTWFPIKEVAILFFGIFMTIIPALAILRAGSHGALAGLLASVKEPGHYFWAAGGLSSFLDNAPTYLTFFNSVLGRFYESLPEVEAVAALIGSHGTYLQAISAGAVFMGANTYIGNAPNFMVRSIALEAGIAMPSFFGYMIRFSIPILIPLFLLVTLVFFR